jgi:peroxiredoxin
MTRKFLAAFTLVGILGLLGFVFFGGRLVADDPPPRTGRPTAAPIKSKVVGSKPAAPAAAATAPEFRSAQEIELHFDRLKIQALAHYLGSADRPDAEAGYMSLFNVVIEHDLFADFEPVVDRYLKDHPDGAVTPLARTIKAMALAGRAKFAEAAQTFCDMVAKIDGQNARFAWSFGETLARQACVAGKCQAARQILAALVKKFPDETELQQEIAAYLKRIELVGESAPAFSVTDLDDRKIGLDDYRGKVLLLEFWATWCGPCVAELENIRATYNLCHDRGFDVLGVSLDENPAAVRQFAQEYQVPWRQIVNRGDAERDIVALYGVDRIPASFLIDSDGKVQWVDLRGGSLCGAVEELLGRKERREQHTLSKGAVPR